MSFWNILVVDDDASNREIIADYLEDGPYVLTMAEDGQTAWQQLENPAHVFDLVILDRMMPFMDGMEVLRRMKATPRLMQTPVIMQTAAASAAQIREGIEAGCYYYLTKPYQYSSLICSIHTALEQLRQERSIVQALSEIPPIPATDHAEYTFSTLDEVQCLAALLAAQCPEPTTVAMGLSELLINAIEHGNLGISYAHKNLLKREGSWEAEITRRLSLPEYSGKKATVHFQRRNGLITFTITDQGQGFDWKKYLDFDPERAFDPNGRGIAMAGKIAFSRIEYQGTGNQVIATVKQHT